MRRIISIITICLLMLTGCTAKEEEPVKMEAVKNVYIQTVQETGHTKKLTLSGTVIPSQTVNLSFKLPGVVSDVTVNEGEYIKKGQVVARMDKSDYSIKAKAAEAEYQAAKLQMESEIPVKTNQAKAQYDLTKASYERLKTLYENEAVAQSQMDEITAKLTVDENTYRQAMDAKAIAETKLQMAEASLDYANSNVSDTVIYSPISGVVLKKLVESGEATDAGYPTVTIGQVDKVWIEIGVSDEYINALQAGQKAAVYVYGLDKSVEGIIDERTVLADTKTRTYPVKILVDNQKEELKPGMICKVDINLEDSEKTLIPLSSVLQLSTGSVVYIYSDETQTAVRREIEIGEIINDSIEVIKGLEYGEKLIVEGQSVIRDGDRVEAEAVGE